MVVRIRRPILKRRSASSHEADFMFLACVISVTLAPRGCLSQHA